MFRMDSSSSLRDGGEGGLLFLLSRVCRAAAVCGRMAPGPARGRCFADDGSPLRGRIILSAAAKPVDCVKLTRFRSVFFGLRKPPSACAMPLNRPHSSSSSLLLPSLLLPSSSSTLANTEMSCSSSSSLALFTVCEDIFAIADTFAGLLFLLLMPLLVPIVEGFFTGLLLGKATDLSRVTTPVTIIIRYLLLSPTANTSVFGL
mmetsp:Transcript_1420/g.1948  ORF Transcript_1420/g.1948 Transcript_1420/m.1948 type:complete len:203 (-) Transcript_1420:1549-2157(-)